MLRLLLVCLFTASLDVRAESCQELNLKIDEETVTLAKLNAQQEELDEKFQRSVVDDLAAQTDGVIDELHRNTAIKVAFARKRLKKAIDVRRAALIAIRSDFCSKCGGSAAKNDSAKAIFCEKCPGKPGC